MTALLCILAAIAAFISISIIAACLRMSSLKGLEEDAETSERIPEGWQ